MRKPLLIVSLLVIIIYACNQNSQFRNPFFSTGKLPAQVFSIDITKDTILVTKKGAVIRIPHGALSASINTVQLEVKEAYNIQEMLEAGLTTQSNGQPLSSGGMIYINAVGENTVKITQKISIATPTSFIEKKMQLFKGAMKNDSTINWTDPTPLSENPQLTGLEKGSVLFQNNCASCHALGKDLTGPDLAHVMKRLLPFCGEGGIHDPYIFTKCAPRVMTHDGYYRCLKDKYGGVTMTSFPDLTRTDLDNLYAWIENESECRNLPIPDISLLKCKDSCMLYNEVAKKWKEIKNRLENERVEMVQEKRAPTSDTSGPPLKVSPIENKSLYYQFTVDAFGWYNIDMLLRNNVNVKQSELKVRIQGQYKEQFNLYLIIPSVKLLEPGGPLNGEEDTYGFYMIDGTIPLPQNAKAFIIAMGEHEDQIIFAKTEFLTMEKQAIDLQLTTISKESFQQQIGSLQLNEIIIKANDTKNAEELKNVVKELKKAEELKPKNCNCDCFIEEQTTGPCCLLDSAAK
jgi:hypothetical protein